MKYNLNKTLIVAIGVGLVACSPLYYTPNTQNVPLISEKGETNLRLSGNGNQVEFQGAVGISDNFAIQGNGGFENHCDTGDLSANILRISIQPNFGFKSEYFSAAVSSRIVNLSYNNVAGGLNFEGIAQKKYLEDNASNFLLEPALTIGAGLEKVKLQVQYGYSINLTNSDFEQDNSVLKKLKKFY